MEYTKVNEQLKYVTASGSTLSCEERMQLEYAMSSLQSSMCFETLFFWGKISGKSFSEQRETNEAVELLRLRSPSISCLLTVSTFCEL